MKKFFLIVLGLNFLFGFSQTDINVMSYNIRLASANDGENNWELRKEKLTDLLNYYEADFIGVQEAQKIQIDYILTNLPEYACIGEPRETGEWAEYSCIFYNKNKYNLVEQNTLWLSETPQKMSKGWDAACYRIVTYGLFQNKKTNKKYWIINTHFDHQGQVARLESAKKLLDLSNQLAKKTKAITIITGDFNADETEESIKILNQNFNNAYLKSIKKPYGVYGTWNGFEFNKIPTQQIDYIFYDKKTILKVKKIKIITDFYDFKYPSDHLPILATFIE